MTFCLGVKLDKGLVAIADTRLSAGTEVSSSKKISVHQVEHHSLFIMTSGLRSVRDKAITYFEEAIEEKAHEFDKLHQAVNELGNQIRRVADEDKAFLTNSGLHFNLHAIVGGQLEKDKEHKLYLVYPEGNWVEIGEGQRFVIIGNSGYGKPILYRNLKYTTSMEDALKLGFLAFDSTRVSANDVDFPIDTVLYAKDSFEMIEHRFEQEDVGYISAQWSALLNASVQKLSNDWSNPLFDKFNETKK